MINVDERTQEAVKCLAAMVSRLSRETACLLRITAQVEERLAGLEAMAFAADPAKPGPRKTGNGDGKEGGE